MESCTMLNREANISNVGNKGRKGFTLIELIVVIGILLALSALAIVNFSGLTGAAEDAAIAADANTLVRQLNMHNSLTLGTPITTAPTPISGFFSIVITDADSPTGTAINLGLFMVDQYRATAVLQQIQYSDGIWRVGSTPPTS